MNNIADEINVLLSTIHLYFPIGMPSLHKKYDGYAKYRSILHDKIEEVKLSSDKNWLSVMSDLELMSIGKIDNLSYLQFPSLKAKININKYDVENLSFTTSIVVVISLLTGKYTIYYEDHIKSLFKIDEKISVSEFINIYLRSKDSSDISIITNIKRIIEHNFPDHDYIDHFLIFLHKIESGFPNEQFDDNSIGNFPIYNYLFDNSLNSSCVNFFE
jgi:hypothetical protein